MSSLPTPWIGAVFALLLPLSAAWAQQQLLPARSTTVGGSQAPLVPELYALRGVTTVLHFDADIDRASIQVDLARIKLVEVSLRVILLAPVMELAPGERLGLRVRYADGASPEEASFAIVSRPPTVDTVVTVLRRQDSLAACQAELSQTRAGCAGARKGVWEVVDRLAGAGVSTTDLRDSSPGKMEVSMGGARAYRLATGLLLTVQANPQLASGPGCPRVPR